MSGEKHPRSGEVFGGGTITKILSPAPVPETAFSVTNARVEIRTARGRKRITDYPVLWFHLPSQEQCCCRYGAAVAGEYPEFPCWRCARHGGSDGLGMPHEMCKRHRKEDQ